MRVPSALNHAPVCAVAVHGDVHASAAGSDSVVASGEAGEEVIERLEEIKRACGLNIASVEKRMNADLFYAVFVCGCNHCLEVVDVRVHVSVRKKSDKVKRVSGLSVGYQFFPRVALKHFAACD